MLQGFKQFIFRGNVLDLAVAVVMGAAFGAVVTALVKDLITPLIAARFPIGDFQCDSLVHPNWGSRVFFHCAAGEQNSRADAAWRGGPRPDH
jgi:large-conductance mechanosensitive channel